MHIIEQYSKLNDKIHKLVIKLPKAIITPARLLGIGIVLLPFAGMMKIFDEHTIIAPCVLGVGICLIFISNYLTNYWIETSKDYVEYPIPEIFSF